VPDLPLPDGASMPGHRLVLGGRPLAVQGAGDVPAQGETGYARCSCGRGSRVERSDAARVQWFLSHVANEERRQEGPARRRLGARLTVEEEVRRCREEREHERGEGGRGVKGGSQVLAHDSSRCGERAGGMDLSLAIMRSGARFAPGADLLKCAAKAP